MADISVTAAVAVVGYNLLGDHYLAVDQRNRIVARAGLVGSTAVSDCEVELVANGKILTTIRNTTAGASKVPVDADMTSVKGFVPKNCPLQAIVRIAPNANAIVLRIELEPYVRTTSGRRTTYGRTYNRAWLPAAEYARRKAAGLL